MKVLKLLTVLSVVGLASFQTCPSIVEAAKRLPTGPLVTIHAPHARELELALDEVELDWSAVPGAKASAPAQQAAPLAGTAIVERENLRALVSVPGPGGQMDILAKAKALKAANPGSEAHLVLYEPGLPKSKATRRLLTREVGLLMESGENPQQALGGLSVGAIRHVPGVPDGYVVEAADPIAALDLAENLRQRPGVRSAYPNLKRQLSAR